MLRVRHAETAHTAAGEVRHGGVITSSPSALNHASVPGNTQVCVHTHAAALINREVGVLQHRGSRDASGPNQSIGIDLTSGRLISHINQLQVTAGSIREGGIEQNLNAAGPQLGHNLLSAVFRYLGHNARGCLNHHKAQV